jgi:HAE1 family hydrophobic/amphiphilic exporter-1
VCSTWLKIRPSPQPKKKSFYHRAYRRGLLICLRNRGVVVAAAAVIFGASLLLIPAIGFEQMAQVDRGVFDIIVKNRPGTRLAVTNEVAKNLESVIQQVPEVRDVSSSVAGETASLRVRLVPAEVRTKTTRQVAEELRPKVTAIPDSQVHFDIERQVSSGKVIEIEVKGYDQRALMFLSLAVKQRLLGVKGITDVVVHQGNPKPEIQIRVLHDKAGLYGLNATQIAYAVRSSVTGPLPTELYREGKEIDLRVRLRDEDIKGFSVLEDLAIPVLAEDGETAMVSLSEVSRFNLVQGMAEINRKDRNRMIKISAEVPEANLLETIDNVKATLDTFKFPKGYGYNFGEKYQEIRENQKEMIFAFCMAIILVYMILASLFESFVYPLTIMFSVPMAIVGSVLTLYFTGKPISVPVYVGAITLAGIAVNNSLVLVDYVKLLKTRGAKRWRAIIKGGESRLRPILMTSGTTLLALLPMAIDKGQGSNLWSPLALTIIGGLVTSTILTLFILPVLVSFLRDQN